MKFLLTALFERINVLAKIVLKLIKYRLLDFTPWSPIFFQMF